MESECPNRAKVVEVAMGGAGRSAQILQIVGECGEESAQILNVFKSTQLHYDL